MRWVWLLGALAGCGDKAIEVTVQVPSAAVSAQYDTSCVRAVQINLHGTTFEDNVEDQLTRCVDIDPPAATFAEIRDRLEGQVEITMPATGLSGIAMYGYSGACESPGFQYDFDLTFFAGTPYIGGDQMTLSMTPNLSCAAEDVTFKPVDVLKLVKGGCAMATWPDGDKISLSTLTTDPFFDYTQWWGGKRSPITGGVATVRGGTKVGPKTCLAVGLFDEVQYHVTCVPPADQRICATGSQLEAPLVNFAVWDRTIDDALYNDYGSLLIGAVYGTGPVAGAQVTIDPADQDRAAVVYFDMPAGVETGTGQLTVRPGTTTGPSGLFGIYTESMIKISVTANGKTVQRTVAGNLEGESTVLVKM
jgi:hypothetical protein